MNYTIEKLCPDDYDKSNNVWNMKSCPFTEEFRKQVADGNRESFLMKFSNEYIASCDLVYNYGEYTEAGVKIYLSRLIVKKEYRGQGIGQELLKVIVGLCREKGYRQITVGVDIGNKTALHVYKKFGFVIYETDEDDHGKFYKMLADI